MLDRYADARHGEELCFLTEMDAVWSKALEDTLTDHGIPFAARPAMGAALAMKVGPILEHTLFYVPAARYEEAKEILQAYFKSAEDGV